MRNQRHFTLGVLLMAAPALSLPVFADGADKSSASAVSTYTSALFMIIIIMAIIFVCLFITRKIGDRWGNREEGAKKASEEEEALKTRYMQKEEPSQGIFSKILKQNKEKK